jgi:5-hydroxyisourate hydrolase
MSRITTHVLDTSRGRPAVGVRVTLELRAAENDWREIGRGETDADGRLRDLLSADVALVAGAYRLTFDTGAYFAARAQESFYPSAVVVFEVRAVDEHYHVPLLLNPFGYSTYRGS